MHHGYMYSEYIHPGYMHHEYLHHGYMNHIRMKHEVIDLLGPQKDFICSYNGLLGTLRGTPKVWKWVSDAYPTNMGQLDHHVVFGTKSGAIQDFQRGKKVSYRGQADPP